MDVGILYMVRRTYYSFLSILRCYSASASDTPKIIFIARLLADRLSCTCGVNDMTV